MDIDLGTGARGFWAFAAEQPSALALIDPHGREWARGELLSECNKLVHGLRAQGLKPGSVVAALLPNCAEYSALNLAITQAGFYLVPLNWHLTGAEVAYILQDSGAEVFVCHQQTVAPAAAAVEQIQFPTRKVFVVGEQEAELLNSNQHGLSRYQDLINEASDQTPDDRSLGAVMFYTSGTTGQPKGVKRNLPPIDPDTSAVMYTMLLSLFGIPPLADNVHFCGSPMYHTAVMNWSTSSLHMGHVLVMHSGWDAEAFLRAVERYKVTTTHVVPTQMVHLHKLPDEIKRQYDVSSMTHMIHTAAPISKPVKAALLDWWGPCIYEYYAATEGGGAIATPTEWLANPGTVGKAWPGAEIKIVDDNNQEAATGEQGTIYLLMNDLTRFEYRGDQQKTEKTRWGDYFTAGDVGYLNDAGFLFLCDRKIDMIISGGANIYPAEIESVLITHPDVLDCCVFGIPDEQWGEQVKAVVQANDSVADEAAFGEQLNEYLQTKLARMKLPKSYDFVAQLPRDPNGKLYKRRLREPYWADHDAKI